MPARQPFTNLCRNLAQPRNAGRADLHVHTTASDGVYTPAQVVDLAKRCGLAALAVTDHDTLAGVGPARQAALDRLEIIAGVEITAEHRGEELHLLGYFVELENRPLLAALARLQARRVDRFREMIERLAQLGIRIDVNVNELAHHTTLGRRHLAEMLVRARKAASIQEAFQRWLRDGGRVAAPKERLPVGEAIDLVRGAGGVAAMAHPSYDAMRERLVELRQLGLGAVEADFPGCRPSQRLQLRAWAKELRLAVSGGSDCHGPDTPRRGLGSCGLTRDELEALRAAACGLAMAES